jgi:hypothetical protein
MNKKRRWSVLLVLLLGLAAPTLAAAQSPQTAQKDPLVISVLKLVLPLGQTLLDKIFPPGTKDTDKKTKKQVKDTLDAAANDLKGKQQDLNDFIDALMRWRDQRIALPLCNLYASNIQEDIGLAMVSDFDDNVVQQVWGRLQKNIELLSANIPVVPPATTHAGIADLTATDNLDDLVLKLKMKVGDLVLSSNPNNKKQSIKDLQQVAETITDLLTKAGTEANVITAQVVDEYSGFSKAIGATNKDQMTSALQKPSPEGYLSYPTTGYLWAQEPVSRTYIYDYSPARKAGETLREAASRQEVDRAEILRAVRATGPEHAVPYGALGYLTGLVGAVLGFLARDPFRQIVNRASGGGPKAPSAT